MATQKINSCFGAQATWPAALKSCCIALCFHLLISAHASAKPFRIQVVDAETSRGIPLVTLESSLHTRHVTDSNGLVAFDEPVAMGRQVHFKPTSHGYRFDAPPLAMGGVTLKPEQGSSATIVMQREMIAQRLYRITGAGIYRDTVALGEQAPIQEPMLNAGVVGQDSTLAAVYNNKMFWIWGDTSHMRHPLAGSFRSTAAWSDLPSSGGLAIDQGVNLQYITEGDFVKPMVNIDPEDKSAIFWLSCLMNVPDKDGHEHLLAWYSRVDSSMNTLARGIVEFDPETRQFKQVADHPTTAPIQPGGHATPIGEGGAPYHILFTSYGQQTRVKATYEAAIDPAQYEALTCLDNEGLFSTATATVRRIEWKPSYSNTSTTGSKGLANESGKKVIYHWSRNAAPTGPREQQELLKAGLLSEEEVLFAPVDVMTGKPIIPHACSLARYGRTWVMIMSELMGDSMLGETWYMEATRPEGPWAYATKVVTHNDYSFYNPLQHPALTPENPDGESSLVRHYPGAPFIALNPRYFYFEGTYTKMFSGEDTPTPWYDYNQVMYRLDRYDSRLAMPEGIYRVGANGFVITPMHANVRFGTPGFYAIFRSRPGTVPVYQLGDAESKHFRFALEDHHPTPRYPSDHERAAFYALPADASPTSHTVGLNRHGYLLTDDSKETPLVRVWKRPAADTMIELQRSKDGKTASYSP